MNQKTPRKVLKAQARNLMVGKYKFLALITVLLLAVNLFSSFLLGGLFYSGSGIFNLLLQLATTGVANIFYTLLLAGQTGICLDICDSRSVQFRDLLRAFQDRPEQVAVYSVLTFILQTAMLNGPLWLLKYVILTDSDSLLLLMTVLSLLLILVIGIILLSLSLVLYLYIDHPEMRTAELLRESCRLMKGNRFRLFWLEVSFFGLDLLGFLTFGIGLLFIEPYKQLTKALFYRSLSNSDQDSYFE